MVRGYLRGVNHLGFLIVSNPAKICVQCEWAGSLFQNLTGQYLYFALQIWIFSRAYISFARIFIELILSRNFIDFLNVL